MEEHLTEEGGQKQVPVITIDGPSGSGKGTLAALLSQKLGWHLLDSGALYRILALVADRAGLFSEAQEIRCHESALETMAESLDLAFVNEAQEVIPLLAGEKVDQIIRTENIGDKASAIAALPGVRRGLLARQKAFLTAPGLIADGRDMGTVVFPDAPLKFYLTASAEERANRRLLQLQRKGHDASLSSLISDIQARDERDMNRPIAPLKPAEDAVIIDSSTASIEEVLTLMWESIAVEFSLN